eukprot:TRINITY_DN7382_c0_g2_i1.p1 TRINITY_DN7382_c0_g2~~TRINITY_DN7382_c0_g2_i1.p1  ORF type:complete len:244 (-),score=37.83 TRINITY_DN7382_c0_g2_i1:108-794(-)
MGAMCVYSPLLLIVLKFHSGHSAAWPFSRLLGGRPGQSTPCGLAAWPPWSLSRRWAGRLACAAGAMSRARTPSAPSLGATAPVSSSLGLRGGSAASQARRSHGDFGGAATHSGGFFPPKSHKQHLDEMRATYHSRIYASPHRRIPPVHLSQRETHVDLSHHKDALRKAPTLYDDVKIRDRQWATTAGKGELESSASKMAFKEWSLMERQSSRNLPVFMRWHSHVLQSL